MSGGHNKAHWRGKPPSRPRSKTGVYKRCRIGLLGMRACPGYRMTKNGVPYGHRRCGGDGWIKVGEATQGRRPGRRRGPGRTAGPRPGGVRAPRTRRPKGTGRTRRRTAGTTLGFGVGWEVADQLVGAVGTTVVAVVFCVVVVLKLLALGLVQVAAFSVDHRTVTP